MARFLICIQKWFEKGRIRGCQQKAGKSASSELFLHIWADEPHDHLEWPCYSVSIVGLGDGLFCEVDPKATVLFIK